MPITCTTVAGAMAIISHYKDNLTIEEDQLTIKSF